MPKGFGETVTASIVNTAILLVTHEYLPKHPTAEEVANHAVEANRIITQFEDAIKKDSEKLYHYDPTDRDGIATTPFIVEAVN